MKGDYNNHKHPAIKNDNNFVHVHAHVYKYMYMCHTVYT